MKRVNGVVFENGQTVSLEATKNELVIDDHIRIPHGELESFIRTVRRLSRDALNGHAPRERKPKASPIPGKSKLAWVKGATPKWGSETLIQRVAVATKRSLGKRKVPRRELEDALAKQLKESRKRIMPAVSTLIHQVKMVEVVQ